MGSAARAAWSAASATACCLLLVSLLAISARASSFPSEDSPSDTARYLIEAFVRDQTGLTDGFVIDMDGSTDWFHAFFSHLRTLKYTEVQLPIVGDPSGYSTDMSRLASLVCPSRPFAYQCQLEASEIKSTVSGSSNSGSFSIQVTAKKSTLYGIDVAGNGALVGYVSSFSLGAVKTWSTASATTDQVTVTPSQRHEIPVAPTDDALASCYDLQVVANTHTVKAYLLVHLAFIGWVGVKHNDPVNYQADSNGKRDARAFSFPELVMLAKSNGLQEARDWGVSNGTAFITVNYTLNVYLATSGASSVDYGPCVNTSSLFAGRRRLHSAGISALRRRQLLQQHVPPGTHGSGAAAAARRPGTSAGALAAVGTRMLQVSPGLAPAQPTSASEQAAQQHALLLASHLRNGNSSQAAAMAAATARASSALSLADKLARVVKAVCVYESGADCDVDHTGRQPFFRANFFTLPPVDLQQGMDAIKMDGAPVLSAVTETLACPPDADTSNATLWCGLRDQDMRTHAEASSHTWGNSYHTRASFRRKTKFTLVLVAESDQEVTLDIGWNSATGTSSSTSEGTASRATVRVPQLKGHCTIINMTTVTVDVAGLARGWLCMSGWVATQQDTGLAWARISPSTKTRWRAHTIEELVTFAKSHNLQVGDVNDWYINEGGQACVFNVLGVSVAKGLRSYVSPAQFPAGSAECQALRPLRGVAPQASTVAAARQHEVAAVHVASSSRRCADLATCRG